MPSMLGTYLEVTEDKQTSVAASSTVAQTPRTVPPQTCLVAVTKATSTDGGFGHGLVDAMTRSEFERAVDRASNGGHDPHYLDIRIRNNSYKPIRAVEAFARGGRLR
jgi:hypothetical protein